MGTALIGGHAYDRFAKRGILGTLARMADEFQARGIQNLNRAGCKNAARQARQVQKDAPPQP